MRMSDMYVLVRALENYNRSLELISLLRSDIVKSIFHAHTRFLFPPMFSISLINLQLICIRPANIV